MIYDDILQQTKAWLIQYVPDWERQHYLLAVSGGVDSMVLLAIFEQLRAQTGLHFHVMHINHQLREASIEEQAFIADYCEKHQVPLSVRIWNHQQLDSKVEVLAREFRYANFSQWMTINKVPYLVTAHHQNDQAETVLMRLLSGNRIESIGGIRPVNSFHEDSPYNTCLRPFLAVEKKALYAVADEKGIPFYEDESNADLNYKRNRMRHKYLPFLEQESPAVQQYLAEFATELQVYTEIAQTTIDKQLAAWQVSDQATDGLDISEWATLPEELAFLLLRRYFQNLHYEGIEYLSRQGYHDIIQFLRTTSQGQWSLPSQYRLIKNYDFIHIEPSMKTTYEQQSSDEHLQSNQWYQVNDQFRVGYFDRLPSNLHQPITFTYSESISLYLRSRKAGDFITLGHNKHQKLRRYFINNKWPQIKRNEAQLLVDAKGEVYAIFSDKELVYTSPNHKKGSAELSIIEPLRIYIDFD